MNALYVVALAGAMVAGCATPDEPKIPARFVPLTDLVADARAYRDTPIRSKGRFFLAFERNEICGILQPEHCIEFMPTESMLIHREAFNRTEAEFVGRVFRREEPQNICARNCSKDVVRILDIEPAFEILRDVEPSLNVRRDPEGPAQDRLVEDADALRQLAERLLICAERIQETPQGCAHLRLISERQELTKSEEQRFNWVLQILHETTQELEEDNDSGQRLQVYVAQYLDDLDPARTTPHGLLCFCRIETCDFADAQPILMDQSVADSMVCIPTRHTDGAWRLERRFFSLEL